MYRESLVHHPGFELVSAYDPDPDRAGAMLRREGVDVPVTGDMDRVLTSSAADAVLITLPNDETPAAIMKAAEAGLHIFAEKPSATSASAFMPAYEAVRRSGVRFVSAYLRRFSPLAETLRAAVADRALGDLVSAQVTFVTTNAALRNATYLAGDAIENVAGTGRIDAEAPTPGERHWLFDRKRSGGGIMHWLGVHWIDLLRFVTGEEFTHVTATLDTRTTAPIDVEDVASVTLESETGMQAMIACAYVLPHGRDQVSVALQGTEGWARWNGTGPDLHIQSTHPAWRAAPQRTFRFEADAVPGYGGALGQDTFEQFRLAILDQTELPMDITDALRVLQILDAIQESGREQRRVAL